ncbi:MAG TPA: MFS transporter [Gammaproteobacteria bacterium]
MRIHNRIQGIPYWRLSGFYFLFFVTVGVILPYWALYLKSIGMDSRQIGILSSIMVFTKIFITFFWGWIVDHTGRRMRVIQIASLFSAISFAFVLFVDSFWGLFLVLLVFSVFWSASLPQIEAATLAHLGASTHAYTSIRVWGSIGFILAVWLLGMVFEVISIGYVPLIILASVIVVWLMSHSIPDNRSVHHEHVKESLATILLRPEVIALFVVCFLMLASHGPYYTFYSIYLEDNGYSSTFIGQMWALGVIAEVILFMYMHKLMIHCRLKLLLMASLLLAALRWLLTGFFVDHVFVLIIAQTLHAASFGMYHAVAIQYVHQYFRGHLQGRGQALYSSSSFGAGLAVGSLVSGYAWDKVGALVCFEAAAIAAIIGMLISWIFLRN